jgi:hypothetical protein
MQSLTANVWTRISYTTTAPVNAAYAVIYSDQDGGTAWVAGDTLDGTGLLIEKSDTLNQYYVGLGDFTYVWTGTANASTSQQKAFIPASTTASNGSARVSSNGLSLTTKSVRVVPTSSTSDTFVEINGFTFQMSKTYTISATLTMLAPQTGSLDTRARKVQVYHSGGFTVGTQAPNVAGSFRSSVTLTITDETQYQSIRLYNGASAGGGDVWWDDILIEESASVLPYFDGSTPAGNDFTYVWSGTANASTSLLKAVPVISVNAFYTNRAISRSSTQWSSSGTKSLRITPIGATNDTFADIAGLLPPGFQFKPNATYTISGTKYTTSSLVSYGNMGFRVNIGVDGEKSPSYRVAPVNTPGVQKLSATFTTGSGGATNFLRVYGGTAAGNGDSWWDDLMLVEGDYTGDYIDGTKPFSKWDGTAHASTSVGYPPQFLDIAGKPELDLDSSTTTLTLPDTLGLTEARTFYTVYVTTQDITSGVFSILTYGSTALNDTVPNSFLTLRQEASAGPANIVRVRRTLGAGPQALNAFGGINVTCWGMDGSGNLFLQNGNNTEQAEVFPVSVPHQKIMYTTSGYHTHTRTIMYRGQHDLATRAAISRYLGNKYGGAVA